MEGEILEVGDVMTPKVLTADEDTPVTKLSKDMEIAEVGSIVITKSGKPVGIVTDRDIALKVIMRDRKASEIKAKEIMSSPLVSIEPGVLLERACAVLAEKGIRRMPVVEDGELRGILSVRNVLTRNPTCVRRFYPPE
ncbi:CBS domain-containing protein [Methanophagales archaeon]|nr:CBS domain-containing protein [Methanophagales archaeon]